MSDMVIDLKQCVEILKENDNFLVLSHEHPDGDTLGSAFALMAALKKLGKKRNFKCSDEISKDFSYITDGFSGDDVGENPFVIAVDVADVHLLGDLAAEYGDKISLCIDHHMSNAYFAEKLLLQDRAAACEIVFKVIKKLGVEIDEYIANCLYTGISTDTGCFRYQNTNAKTFRAVAELVEIRFDGVITRNYQVGVKANELAQKYKNEILYSMRECNYLRFKSKPFGWKYGVNKVSKSNGKERLKQYAYDFYGNKELIKTI